MNNPTARRRCNFFRATLASAVAALLMSCGGGGDGYSGGSGPAACSLADQQNWLGSYMNGEYFWYAQIPSVDPAAYATIDNYFATLLSPGVPGNASLPKDIWSYSTSTASFDQYFGEGKTLGYGVFVAGLEVAGQPSQPLRVRYIEPASPAASTSGSPVRGETIISINGLPASDYITRNDYSVLSPTAVSETIDLIVRNTAGATRSVQLLAAVYSLTPVSQTGIVRSPANRAIGYVVLKDFVSQALTPLETVFANFRSQGVREIVLDLRYNGGGVISVANALASYVVPLAGVNQTFTTLNYSDKRQFKNDTSRFADLVSAIDVTRVFVLSGQRTCSASELVVNGLKPFVDVIQIGDTTCGKPVGFVAADNCGTTFSAINFEALNSRNEGRYWSGLAPTCPLADDLDHALGDPQERLLDAARTIVDGGSCPVAATRELPSALRGLRPRVNEGERPGMWMR